MSPRITIALDGYAACGKSTLARDLCEALNYSFIDTGAMYRAVTGGSSISRFISIMHNPGRRFSRTSRLTGFYRMEPSGFS
ncbi:MAG: (d)CMP kinase [Saprospiraceae bacterium]|nr:(d)CMP kinase [Saprospiraceae bacterium]